VGGSGILGEYHSPCSTVASAAREECEAACTGSRCLYSVLAPVAREAPYELRVRATLLNSTGVFTSVTWTFRRCDITEYAQLRLVCSIEIYSTLDTCASYPLLRGGMRRCAPHVGLWCCCLRWSWCLVCRSLHGRITCLPCPAGGDCAPPLHLSEAALAEDADVVLGASVVSRRGFWAAPTAQGSLAAPTFYECPIKDACLPPPKRSLATSNSTISDASVIAPTLCANGYQGIACSVCADGYFEQFGLCRQCPSSKHMSALAIVAAVVGVAVVVVLLFKARHGLPVDVIKLGVSMCVLLCNSFDIRCVPAVVCSESCSVCGKAARPPPPPLVRGLGFVQLLRVPPKFNSSSGSPGRRYVCVGGRGVGGVDPASPVEFEFHLFCVIGPCVCVAAQGASPCCK
jgi:hypothetical protein